MRLSKNFTLAEFTNSDIATRYALENIPSDAEINSIKLLAEKVLQPMRDGLGSLYISSGFRCKTLNSLANGSDNSQHIIGQAADIKSLSGWSSLEVCQWVLDNGIDFDQMINEYGKWTHISYISKSQNRNEVLTATKVFDQKAKKYYTKCIKGLKNG